MSLETRQREIAEIGARLIAERGFGRTGVRDIAQGINVSVSTLYDYVRTKEEVLVLIVEHWTELWRDALAQVAETDDHPFRRLQGAVKSLIELDELHPELTAILYREQTRLDRAGRKLLADRESERIGIVARLVAEAAEQGLVDRAADPVLVATALLFLVDSLPVRASVHFETEDAASWTQTVLDMVINGYGLPAGSDEERQVHQSKA